MEYCLNSAKQVFEHVVKNLVRGNFALYFSNTVDSFTEVSTEIFITS